MEPLADSPPACGLLLIVFQGGVQPCRVFRQLVFVDHRDQCHRLGASRGIRSHETGGAAVWREAAKGRAELRYLAPEPGRAISKHHYFAVRCHVTPRWHDKVLAFPKWKLIIMMR